MRTARAFAGVAMALAMQTTMDRFLAGRTIAVDLVLVSIVYVALTRGPAADFTSLEDVLVVLTPQTSEPLPSAEAGGRP